MAQRMESAAPPGGVMLSESTARLVENTVLLGEPELVAHQGRRRLRCLRDGCWRSASTRPVGAATRRSSAAPGNSTRVTALLDEAVGGAGCVVTVVGPAGNRQEPSRPRDRGERGQPRCPRLHHLLRIPHHRHPFQRGRTAIARQPRESTVCAADASARTHSGQIAADADPEDLLLIDDLLGIGDPETAPPDVGPDARRRRLTALVNGAALAQRGPDASYVIEDVHWIDAASESMLADFMPVIPQAPSLMLITYRPEYRGTLSRVPGAQTIALAAVERCAHHGPDHRIGRATIPHSPHS